MRDPGWLRDLPGCLSWGRRTAERGEVVEEAGLKEGTEKAISLAGGTGDLPATPWLFWAQVDNDRLKPEARAHLEKRKWTFRDRDIIPPCP